MQHLTAIEQSAKPTYSASAT